METELKGKWKEFALAEVLYQWSSGEGDAFKSPHQLYDLLVETQSEDQVDLIGVFQKYKMEVWGPFECWEYFDVVDYMKALAMKAQEVEAQP